MQCNHRLLAGVIRASVIGPYMSQLRITTRP